MESKLVPFMANRDDELHIAMFPWLAFGHMIPFLELAKLIAQKGHKISFISTPRNIDRLPKLPPHLAPFINFVKIPLPYVENLPRSAEATADLPAEDVVHLKKAYDCLQEPLSNFLQSSLPDWIVFDFVSYWVPDIACKFNIPSVYFSIFISACLCYLSSGEEDYRRVIEDYIVAPKWVPFPSKVAYRLFEVRKIFEAGITGDESNIYDIKRFQETMKNCDLIAARTCFGLEPEWLQLTEQLHQKPVFPVGVLPRETDQDSEEDQEETWKPIKKWLDRQEKRSVVYIAFGSEALPSQEEVIEIAHGLELSGLPFFWVLRKSCGLSEEEEVVDLPNGFEDRVKDRGMVFTNWAPQLRILGHESIGAFLTHSGICSVVEALQHGRPLVLLPFNSDQGLNAKLLEEKKIGYLMPRNEEDGSFTRNSVAESLRLVIVEEEGKIYRDKAEEMRALFTDKDRQSRYVDAFLDYLKTQRLRENGNKVT
ncbi:UDP-glycosyltransferase 91A1 [Ricinus communis]|uniref:Glycosyltransferase n=1 Tax=Ricinus communis TaxID=3988 RepID=B9T5J9_RICCO|nr:UDP-glycosyltransferase 91A1 [Ricinus communis]EEF28862.1 UDP-glucosyltransferase, putative [Ricinus communis]|eukprot:XP_002533518.1 UDP-glycosyltransferase 91A1 [Ricinus communis]